MTALSWPELLALVQRHGAAPGADLCACAGADAESGRDPDVPPGDGGISWGLWQMEQGAGLGGQHSGDELRDPEFAASIMVPLYNRYYTAGRTQGLSGEELVRYTCMETERPYGYPNYHSRAADRYLHSWQVAEEALMRPTTPVFDPTVPAERQVQSWACSIRTVTWMLHSIGQQISAGDVQDLMLGAGLVSPAEGLLDGSGGHLAVWLSSYLNVPCHAQWVDWPTLVALAGTAPIGLGGVNLNHWVGVRGPGALPDSLAIANPAPNWHNIGDVLTQDEFATWGPWAMVVIDLPTEEPGLSDSERAELDTLRTLVASYVDDTLTPMAATLDALLAHPPSKAALLQKLAELRQSIQTNVGV